MLFQKLGQRAHEIKYEHFYYQELTVSFFFWTIYLIYLFLTCTSWANIVTLNQNIFKITFSAFYLEVSVRHYCFRLSRWVLSLHFNYSKKSLKIPKRVIRSRKKSKMNTQHSDQMKKGKRTNNDLQNTTQKTNHWNMEHRISVQISFSSLK